MKSVIVGTAGHIDHGKTALVKALTGIDADRLAEEKQRGITIDIGFAHLELPGPLLPKDGRSGAPETLRLGFVDVPGHERFVRNMLAGVGGIDLVLLVIGADEGVKPQTIEHFDICRLLNIPRGMTVLTKADLVDEETLAVVRMEVEEYLRGSFLDTARAPLVTVSSRTGAGLEELKRELARLAAEAPAKDSGALFRLPVDRVFTMKGFGTVVTGTLVSGAVCKEQELEVFPSGKRVRVRGIQVHSSAAEQAVAGERTALNLAGVTTDELARGMTLAEPGVFHTTSRADVLLSLLPVAKPLRDRARVHFHSYTAETIAEVVLLADARVAHDPDRTAPLKHLLPGAEAFAQLRLADPLLLLPGDRFILRQFSPVVTLGGGVVIDASPPARKKVPREAWLMAMSSLATGVPGQKLSHRVARRGAAGLTMTQAVAETGWPRPVIESILPEYTRALSRLGEVLVANAVVMRLRVEAVEVIERFQAANPLLPGIGKEELRARLGAADEVFASVLDALVREKKVEVAGEVVRAAGRGVVMKDEEAESKRAIEEAFATAGLKVPALKEVLAGLKVDRTRAQQIVTLLLRDKVLVKLSDDLVFHRATLEDLRRRLVEQKSKSARIDVGQFKDLFGVSRKYAIPLLEYLDRERVTRRVGDIREIL